VLGIDPRGRPRLQLDSPLALSLSHIDDLLAPVEDDAFIASGPAAVASSATTTLAAWSRIEAIDPSPTTTIEVALLATGSRVVRADLAVAPAMFVQRAPAFEGRSSPLASLLSLDVGQGYAFARDASPAGPIDLLGASAHFPAGPLANAQLVLTAGRRLLARSPSCSSASCCARGSPTRSRSTPSLPPLQAFG
jgi:hypothetical protein